MLTVEHLTWVVWVINLNKKYESISTKWIPFTNVNGIFFDGICEMEWDEWESFSV